MKKKKRHQLTTNFFLDEWDCKDGTPVPAGYVSNALRCAKNLQALRDDINIHNRPKSAPKGVEIAITLISGWRTPYWNMLKGGAKNSKHLIAIAADIVCKYLSPKQIFQRIERLIRQGKMTEGGLKAYAGFTHYDCRKTKARW